MHSKSKATVFAVHAELDLVAIAPCILRVANRLHEVVDFFGGEMAYALERRAQVFFLSVQLGLSTERSPRAATANTHEGAEGRDAHPGWFDDIGGSGSRERWTV